MQRLQTSGVDFDSILTKDYVGKEITILSAVPTTTQYGPAYILDIRAGKKSSKSLCGASVLVKTIDEFLSHGGKFPIVTKVVKPEGARYYVFD